LKDIGEESKSYYDGSQSLISETLEPSEKDDSFNNGRHSHSLTSLLAASEDEADETGNMEQDQEAIDE